MRKENINQRRQKDIQVEKKAKRDRILHRSSWILFVIAIFILFYLGIEKAETMPYIILILGLVFAAIVMRMVLILPLWFRHKRKVGKGYE